jgi:hypothetical protein
MEFIFPKIPPTGVGSLGVLPNVRPLDALKMLTVATRKKKTTAKLLCPAQGSWTKNLLNSYLFP